MSRGRKIQIKHGTREDKCTTTQTQATISTAYHMHARTLLYYVTKLFAPRHINIE